MTRRQALRTSAQLLGASIAATAFGGLLHGCQVDTSLDWTPQFFTNEQATTVAELAEHILPRTDTPGAKDVFVDRFIDQLIAETYAEEQKAAYQKGLQALEQEIQQQFGRPLAELSQTEKDKLLMQWENEAIRPARYIWGALVSEGDPLPFYRQLKGLILLGYFSSETVGEEVLTYEPVPGRFIGCVDWTEEMRLSSI